MLGAGDRKKSTFWTQEAHSVVEEVRSESIIKLQCWKCSNRGVLKIQSKPWGVGDPTGLDWGREGRTVCCPSLCWVSRDSAGAIPTEPVLWGRVQLLGGYGGMEHEWTLAPWGRRMLAISGSYLKDTGWSLQSEGGMQEVEAKSFSKFAPLSHTGQKR